jgi:arylsulfatase A-like enzyme
VILVVVDTLRADTLAVGGAEESAMPNLDAWAAESVVFTAAYSQAPWTLPSFASLFTATYPVEHGATGHRERKEFFPIRQGLVTATESFKNHGYATGAFVNNIFLKGDFGFRKGFDTYDFFPATVVETRSAEEVTGLGIHWLGTHAEPFFLMLHYFDPHFTYRPPAEFARQFGGSLDGPLKRLVDPLAVKKGKVKLNEWDKDNLKNLYKGEAAYTDQELKRLFDYLEKKGLLEKSVVIVTSDHGEEFWDHGDFEHGHSQYEELVKVPLIIRFPGREHAGKVVESPVRLMDLMPTVHAYLGLETPSTFRGKSFLDTLEGKRTNEPLLFEACLYGQEIRAMRAGDLKVIVNTETGATELYNIEEDPLEKNDLAADRPEETEKMSKSLLLLREKLDASQGEGPVNLSRELMKELEKLGYAGK